MTDEQKLEILYNLLEGIDFEDMFNNVYTSVLSLNDRTPHGIHHKSYDEIKLILDNDEILSWVIATFDKEMYAQYIHNSKDISVFILDPFEDTDLVIMKINDMDAVAEDIDAATKMMAFSTEDKNRTHLVNIIALANMKDDLIRGRSSYVYMILGHELIHFLIRYLDKRVFEGKYEALFAKSDILAECMCDLWAFVLTTYVNYYKKYKTCKTIGDAFLTFLNDNMKVAPDEYTKYLELLNNNQPTWLKTIVDRLQKK